MKLATSNIGASSESLKFWRISTYISLDGTGASRGGGRWNSPGRPVVYLAESPAGAMLETIVHLSLDRLDLPESYRLLEIEVSTNTPVSMLNISDSSNWKDDATITRQIGDAWLERAESPLVRVPSVIVPYTWNYLMNPRHVDAGRINVAHVSEHLHDPRLLRIRGR